MFDLKSFIEFWQYNPENPLLFTSKGFLLLFVSFLSVYTLLKKYFNARVVYVTAFSVYFYYLTSGTYFWILILMSVTDFSFGYFIDREKDMKIKRVLLAAGLIIDLGLLFYFKYTNFLLESLHPLFSSEPFKARDIFLPVGVSFFTFQSISYIIDIYRGRLRPTERWVDYLFYLSFFPQLVAGPIVRAKDFLPQIYHKPFPTRRMADFGLMFILIGLVKKAIISDYIGINFVDRVFDNPLLYSGFENLMGIYGYAIQIYCDFSGYSDMAVGIALLLGFKFPENFHLPYQARSITDFWHRWHMSLSSWLKDYLYIALGGNRKGKVRTYINLMLTMLIGGLWHGAAMRFIIWGGLHGVALCFHKLYLNVSRRLGFFTGKQSMWKKIFNTFLTFNFVCFCWIFFRAKNMDVVREMLGQIATSMDIPMIPTFLISYWKVIVLIVLAYIGHFIPYRIHEKFRLAANRLPAWLKIIISILIIYVAVLLQDEDVQPFIYFQF